MLKRIFAAAILFTIASLPVQGQLLRSEYETIDIYVEPFYSSEGPEISVGPYSLGLASKNEGEFLKTIFQLKKQLNRLSVPVLYVAAIRLYDRGYRKESVYWFYTAQFRARQFQALVDKELLGSIGSPGFEQYHACDAFFQLVGTYIGGYAFTDPDALLEVLAKVKKDMEVVPEMNLIYPGVVFKKKELWATENAEFLENAENFILQVKTERESIERQRKENGSAAEFARLRSKDLPVEP